jgi:hypothetical protein
MSNRAGHSHPVYMVGKLAISEVTWQVLIDILGGNIMIRQAYWTVCKLLRATDQYNSSHFVKRPPRVATTSGYG